ncbi:MAG: flavin-dependent monooxygenase [Xanthobacteraceae bacterium]|nr:flavin-dependent monooxygenase [Xanthobacteraceae bacterium]
MVEPNASRPDVKELLNRARAIAELVRARAQQTEVDRRISPEVIEAMRKAELFKILQPKVYGGFEYGFDVFVKIIAAIARGCGSSSWVYGLLASHQWITACFPKQAQDDFWSDRNALAAGSYAPIGQVMAVEGGYRLTGKWGFASGCDNAQWLYLGGTIPDAAGPRPGLFLVPSADCTIDDNWRTMGLAGTGSMNIVVNNAFVPAHRFVPYVELAEGIAPGTRVNTNPLYRQSFFASLPVTIVAPVLGMAEGALEYFLAMIRERVTRGAAVGGQRAMADFTTIQMRIAEASASIDAARLITLRDLDEMLATVSRGESPSKDLRLRNRRDHSFCVRLLVQAVDAVFLAAGGQGLFLDLPLQRIWRDAHAASSHISLNWDAVSTMYGQHLVGLEPKGQY